MGALGMVIIIWAFRSGCLLICGPKDNSFVSLNRSRWQVPPNLQPFSFRTLDNRRNGRIHAIVSHFISSPEPYLSPPKVNNTSTKPIEHGDSMGFGGNRGASANLKNAVIAFLAPLPSIIFYLSFLNHHYRITASGSDGDGLSQAPLWTWSYRHPLLLANAFFFLNVNLLFWLIGHIQKSHWVRTLLLFSFSFRTTLLLFTFPLIVDFLCLVWLCR